MSTKGKPFVCQQVLPVTQIAISDDAMKSHWAEPSLLRSAPDVMASATTRCQTHGPGEGVLRLGAMLDCLPRQVEPAGS
jgi:hypothetical protein